MKTRDMTPPHVGPISLKIALIYAVLGGFWILISDLALSALFKDPATLTRVGIFKEWLFIGITAFMLYLLIKRTLVRIGKSEEDLRQSEKKFHMLVETAASAIFIYRGRILQANPAMELLTGYSKEELLTMSYYDFVHPDFIEKIREHCEALSDGAPKPLRCEFKILTKGGEERWVDFTSSVLLYDGELAGMGTAFDVTERVKAEKALLSAEAKFRTLVEQALVGIYIIKGGRFIYVNPTFEEIFGYARDEILSLGSLLELVADEDRPRVEENVRKRLQGEVKSVHYVFKGRRKDGTVIDIEAHGNSMDFEGQPVIIGVLADITERTHAEAALRESETNLRIILDSVYDAIFIHDVDGAIIDVNDKMLKMYGVAYEEARALTIRDDYSSPDNPLETLPYLWKKVVSGEPQLFEWKARRPRDGSVFDVEVFLCRITLKNRDAILANVRDITRRKRSEAALRESEERIRLLMESAEDIVVMQDLEGRYLYYNAAPRYGLKAEEVLGKTPFDFLDPETAGQMMEQIRQVAASGQGLSVEREAVLQGEAMWFLDQVSPIRNATGGVKAVVRISRNITERKLAEEALGRSHRQNQLLLEAVGEGIYGVDMQGKLTFANPVALGMFGYEASELTGQAIHYMVHHTKADGTPYPCDQCPTYEALKDGAIRHVTDEVFWRRDGTSFPVEYVSTPILERGEIVGSVVVFIDITERRKAEAALQESGERYRAIAETASDAIVTIDEESRVLFANPAVVRIFGYRPDEIIGREVTVLMPERLRKRHLSGLKRYVETGRRSTGWETMEYQSLHKDGHEIPIELSYATFRKEGSLFFTGIVRDITERKQAEKEKEYKDMLERFNQELEALITERTMSLMALKLADRVRNPAAVIGWMGKRAIREGELPEKVRESLLDIVQQADNLEVIVRDFQSLLKGKKPVFGYDDINEIVRGVLPVIERESADKRVALVVYLSEGPLRMNAQRDLLRMAVFNLLRNALEATPEGGKISVSTTGDGSRVTLCVSDTGFGIPKEILDRIFDPFFTMKAPTFRIGLPLIKQVVSEHLGTVEVESEIGKGTTFRLHFPVRWTEKMGKGEGGDVEF